MGICVGPLLEAVVLPSIEAARKQRVSSHTKFTLGFTLVVLANLAAAGIEYMRAGAAFADVESNCAATGVYTSKMSILWMCIPMLLTGFGELFVNPVIYHFSFENSPTSLRSISQGFNLVASGCIAGCITTSYTSILIPKNFNYWTNSTVDHWVDKQGNLIPNPEDSTGRGQLQPFLLPQCWVGSVESGSLFRRLHV